MSLGKFNIPCIRIITIVGQRMFAVSVIGDVIYVIKVIGNTIILLRLIFGDCNLHNLWIGNVEK